MAITVETTCANCRKDHLRPCFVARGKWRCVCPCRKGVRYSRAELEPDYVPFQAIGAAVVYDDDGWCHGILGDFSIRLGADREGARGNPVRRQAMT